MSKNYEAVKRMKAKYASQGKCSSGCGRQLFTKTYCKPCVLNKSARQNPKRNKKRIEFINKGFCSNGCGEILYTKWFCIKCNKRKNFLYKRHYKRNIEKERKAALSRAHKKNFGGLRPAILERDKFLCQICFHPNRNILVHHINENPKDNRMENLICLCKVCHVGVERINSTKPDLRHLFPWFQ